MERKLQLVIIWGSNTKAYLREGNGCCIYAAFFVNVSDVPAKHYGLVLSGNFPIWLGRRAGKGIEVVKLLLFTAEGFEFAASRNQETPKLPNNHYSKPQCMRVIKMTREKFH